MIACKTLKYVSSIHVLLRASSIFLMTKSCTDGFYMQATCVVVARLTSQVSSVCQPNVSQIARLLRRLHKIILASVAIAPNQLRLSYCRYPSRFIMIRTCNVFLFRKLPNTDHQHLARNAATMKGNMTNSSLAHVHPSFPPNFVAVRTA